MKRLALLILAMGVNAVMTHGPVVGAVTPTSATVWVRTSGVASVSVRYSVDPTLTTFDESAPVTTTLAADFTAHIPITSLLTNTVYYLDVLVDGVGQLASPYPHFKTFPTGAVPFKFVVLTDFARPSTATELVATFASAAAEGADVVLIGGDFDHRTPRTLPAKRQMFKDLYTPALGYEEFVAILRATPIIHQWDDHDYGQANGDKTNPNKAKSLRVFNEYVPAYPHSDNGIWQSFSYGDLADFFVLDSRYQRDPSTDPDGPDKSMLDGDNLGATGQLQWLKDGLLASVAKWKIIATPVVFNPTNPGNDSWFGYATERTALVDFITANGITGIILISGDRHTGGIDNGANSTYPEMLVPTANASPCHQDTGVWSEGTYGVGVPVCWGYGVVTVTAESVVLEVKDQFGIVQLSYTVTE